MIKEIRPINKLYLKWIDNKLGWGVFTEDVIKKGEIVERCYCVADNYKTSSLKDYIFSDPYNSDDSLHCLGFGAIYNHDDEPNMKWLKPNQQELIIDFFAIRDIEVDEQLTHNYGKYYWKEKKLI